MIALEPTHYGRSEPAHPGVTLFSGWWHAAAVRWRGTPRAQVQLGQWLLLCDLREAWQRTMREERDGRAV